MARSTSCHRRDRLVAALVTLVGVALLQATAVGAQPARSPASALPGIASFSYREVTTRDGLPLATIRGLAETHDGYLWLATPGGLVRFDGVRFVLFDRTNLPEMGSNWVASIAVAVDGSIWVSTTQSGTVVRTDGERVFERIATGAAAQVVTHALVAPDGALWLWAGSPGLLQRFAEGRWTSREAPDSRLLTLTFGNDGTPWLGTAHGLLRLTGDGLSRAAVGILPDQTRVDSILQDRDGQLWVGGDRGLSVIDVRSPQPRLIASFDLRERVTALTEDHDGGIWAGTKDGVYRLHRVGQPAGAQLWELAFEDVGLGGSTIHRMLTTRSGAVVVATAGAGLRIFTPQPVRMVGTREGLPDPEVHHLVSDGAGGLWVGIACEGLTHIDGNLSVVAVHRTAQLGLEDNCVRALHRDRRGTLWIGQFRGHLTRLEADGSTRSWDETDGLPPADIGPLVSDRQERVWVGSASGTVCRVEPGDVLTCPAVTLPLPNQHVWSMAEDTAGSIWIGQVGRLTRVSPDGTQTLTQADGVPDAPIRSLRVDPDGTVWLVTYGAGLVRFRGGRFAQITTTHGLPDNGLSAFEQDDRGRAWLLTNRGVLVVPRSQLDAVADGRLASLDGIVFGPAEDLPEGNSGQPAAAWLDGDRVAFATVNGLGVFSSSRVGAGPAPAVMVEQVTDRGRTLPHAASLTIQPGGGPLSIRFSAPSIGNPSRVQVRYQLVGRDPDWVHATDERRAYYSGLAPRTFAFRLSARSAGGPWSEPVTAVTIRVLPFWWQTWWARGLAVAASVFLIAGIVQLRHRAVVRRNEALEREIKERQRAEEEAHRHLLALAHVGRLATAGELTASLAHELGQPLTAVVANAEASRMMLAAPGSDPAAVDAVLKEITQQGRRASDIIRGLREFLRRGAGKQEDLDLGHVIREVVTLVDSTLTSTRTQLALDLVPNVPTVKGDRVGLQQVLLNLTINAVEAMRETPAERRCLVVRTRHGAACVRVSVLDRGPGLDAGASAHIFEPFHTSKPDGMGMGLAICRSIVEAHGGRIRGRNCPTGGAVFSFTLPTGRRADLG